MLGLVLVLVLVIWAVDVFFREVGERIRRIMYWIHDILLGQEVVSSGSIGLRTNTSERRILRLQGGWRPPMKSRDVEPSSDVCHLLYHLFCIDRQSGDCKGASQTARMRLQVEVPVCDLYI
jgi:hypothetical protein